MREIKLRAWDKKHDWMEYFTLGYCELVYSHLQVDDTDNIGHQLNYVNWEDCEIMQFTGLKDKKGKEIYEGDILKQVYRAGYSLAIVKFGVYDNGESYEGHVLGNGFYIEETSFCVDTIRQNLKNEIDTIMSLDMKAWEIIGDIYRNPGLLTEVV